MLQDKAVLVIEDNVFLALDLSDVIERLKGRVVGPAATATEALHLLGSEDIGAAVIDGDVLDVDVAQIVMQLAEKAIPVVIHTASELPPEIIDILPDVPVLLEPVHTKLLVTRLVEEMSKRTGNAKSD